MSQASDNAKAFASTADPSIAEERHAGVTKALELIVAGRPGRALYELARSVARQARIAGLGDVDLAPGCPCGDADVAHTSHREATR